MKKYLSTMLAVSLLPLTVQAADTGVGCGVGAMIFEGQSGVGPHILAATTNGTLYNQFFGITSGTLGCDPMAPITLARADIYLNGNIEQLARDMATGGGEALTTLAQLLEIETQDKASFFVLTQQNFQRLFPTDEVTGTEVLLTLRELMAGDPTLARYVAS